MYDRSRKITMSRRHELASVPSLSGRVTISPVFCQLFTYRVILRTENFDSIAQNPNVKMNWPILMYMLSELFLRSKACSSNESSSLQTWKGPRKLYWSCWPYRWQGGRICLSSRVDENLLWAVRTTQGTQEGNSKSNSQHFWIHCQSYWVSYYNINN